VDGEKGMTAGRNTSAKKLWYIALLFSMIVTLVVCKQPDTDMIVDDPGYITRIEFFFYPGNEIIFHETFGLFCTTLYLNAPAAAIESFHVTLGFDHTVMEYESIYSHNFIVNTSESSGLLHIDASDIGLTQVDYLELCTVTWKAVKTSITDISLTIDEITAQDGMPVERQEYFSNTVKILEELGTIGIQGDGVIEKGSDFSNTLYFDSDDKIIVDYDIDITYDSRKISVDDTIGDNGMIIGTDGFVDTIFYDSGKINIRGRDDNGAGPGTDLEFLLMHWHAIDSGKTVISVRINKVMTLDNVYIKPSIRSRSISITKSSNKPHVKIWFDPETVNVKKNESFITKIILNTEGYTLAAYGFKIYYDDDVIAVDTSMAPPYGVEKGKDGFIPFANIQDPGVIIVAGFEALGVPPNPELELLIIHWKAINPSSSSEITMTVDTLADYLTIPIDSEDPGKCTVTVNE
jgi:hypothetical protein